METDFKLFDPQIHTENSLPNEPGNYIVVLRPGCHYHQSASLPHTNNGNMKGNNTTSFIQASVTEACEREITPSTSQAIMPEGLPCGNHSAA